MKFYSKAKTIEKLFGLTKHSNILSSIRFTYSEYYRNKKLLLKKIKDKFDCEKLIVRSSSHEEDNETSSNAGHYKSILDVPRLDKGELSKSIQEVFNSFDSNSKNEVFIQPMLQNMKKCGVAFTADIDTLAPYYIINFDDLGSPEAVTSGSHGSFQTYIQLKNFKPKNSNTIIQKLILAFKELEKLFQNNFLDIEFAVNSKNEIYIFQVRPIVIQNKENYYKLDLKEALYKVERKIEKLSSVHPNLLGEKAIFGIMPDWNPAEIIGAKPKRLSLSLYKEFITDNIWAYQRDNYGYRNLRSHPLLISFLGVPYIDVRVDFNSFIPKKLNEETSKKLVEYYLNKLSNIPTYHDKIEFKIVHSCYYFNIEEKLNELASNGFKNKEIREIKISLLELTNKIIDPNFGHFKKDLEKIHQLIDYKNKVINSKLSRIDKIYWLTEYCKRYGTLPFAGIARAAFISTQVLRSIEELGIINLEQYNDFLKSLKTITSEMEDDLYSFSLNRTTKNDFLQKYGHLRPGTYDILSLRYDENFENYFSNVESKTKSKSTFTFMKRHLKQIDIQIRKSNLKITSPQLIKFIRESIEAREYSKFIFTSCISEILKLIQELGATANKTREEMAHVDFRTILNLYNDLDHHYLDEIFKADIKKYKKLNTYTNAVKLPSLILNSINIYNYFLNSEEPNFVSLNKACSSLVKETDLSSKRLSNKIIMIESADPGYDYLFSKKIGGLITQYGGANSHMAVRCAELGIPAVIGAGEYNFTKWSKAKILEIDAVNKQVKIIS